MTLQLQNVSKTVGDITYIKPTNLTLAAGTMNILLAPTSSGKTRLMRLMAGLDVATQGKIFWQGQDVTKARIQHRDMAMVYQQFINYPTLSVFDNIASPLKVKGLTKGAITAKVEQTASLLKLTPVLRRKPFEISGGQQQRTALARALVKEAGLVLLDEPLANLDYKLREQLREEIPKIFAASGAIFVYATTEPEEALLLGGHTATMTDGRITQFGPTTAVYHLPKDKMSAQIFSDPPMNFLKVNKTGNHIDFGNSEHAEVGPLFDGIADGEYQAGFRAHHLSLTRHSDDVLSFNAQLAMLEITGSKTFIHIDYHKQRLISLCNGIHDLQTGTPLRIYLQPKYIYLFDDGGKLIQSAGYTRSANLVND